MNSFPSKRTGKPVFAIITLIMALVAIVYLESRPRPEPGQTVLTDIQNIETLRAQFNRDAGQTRLVLLVSPT